MRGARGRVDAGPRRSLACRSLPGGCRPCRSRRRCRPPQLARAAHMAGSRPSRPAGPNPVAGASAFAQACSRLADLDESRPGRVVGPAGEPASCHRASIPPPPLHCGPAVAFLVAAPSMPSAVGGFGGRCPAAYHQLPIARPFLGGAGPNRAPARFVQRGVAAVLPWAATVRGTRPAPTSPRPCLRFPAITARAANRWQRFMARLYGSACAGSNPRRNTAARASIASRCHAPRHRLRAAATSAPTGLRLPPTGPLAARDRHAHAVERRFGRSRARLGGTAAVPLPGAAVRAPCALRGRHAPAAPASRSA